MAFDRPVKILTGPNVADWRETARITRVEFTNTNFFVRHTKETGPEAWPSMLMPGRGNLDEGGCDPGSVQWTLYLVFKIHNHWITAPCVEFWADPILGVHRCGPPAPFSRAAKLWYPDVKGLAGHQPVAGDKIGVMAVAGMLLDPEKRFAVQERTPIAWIEVPQDDSGVCVLTPDAVTSTSTRPRALATQLASLSARFQPPPPAKRVRERLADARAAIDALERAVDEMTASVPETPRAKPRRVVHK